MGCPLDPATLVPGHCAQTLFADVKVVLYRHGDAVRLHVERSLAQWLLDWLRQAATSFEPR
jgi:sarcosine oxidase gamma subunit